jgi:glycosyltransferase involved in cell wall biosynthesis
VEILLNPPHAQKVLQSGLKVSGQTLIPDEHKFRHRNIMNYKSKNGRTVIFNNMVTPYSNRLYNELRERGHNIAVISCSDQEPNRSWAQSITPNYPHKVLPGYAFQLSEARFAHVNTGIFRALRGSRPSRLIINGFYPSMLSAAIWAVATGTPLGLITDGWAHTMPTSIYHSAVRPFVLRHCRAVACCGNKGAEYMREQGIAADRIVIVPLVPGWNPPAHIPSYAERSFDLLWCAHMNDKVKNISFFVDVAIALNSKLQSLKIRLVGRGNAEQLVVARLTDAGIEHQHDIHLDWKEMVNVFTNAKFLLLPSLWEPWGLVCNEAMQCGAVPIVSPFVGAADDLVISAKNGVVCPLQVGEWVSTIERLLPNVQEWTTLSRTSLAEAKCRNLKISASLFEHFIEMC